MRTIHITDVIVDVRERERSVRGTEYYRNKGLKVCTRMLPYGDYLFNNKVVWEYKTVTDFISSIFNESVFNEVFNQSSSYDYSFLIIVGDLDKDLVTAYYSNPIVRNRYPTMQRYKNHIREIVRGAIRRCRTICNVIIVKNEKEAFKEMLKQSDKCVDNKKYGGVIRKSRNKDLSPFEVFLSCIGGIGDVTSKKIVDGFNVKSLDDLLEISYEDLLQQGIKRDKAKAYCKYVYGEDYMTE